MTLHSFYGLFIARVVYPVEQQHFYSMHETSVQMPDHIKCLFILPLYSLLYFLYIFGRINKNIYLPFHSLNAT